MKYIKVHSPIQMLNLSTELPLTEVETVYNEDGTVIVKRDRFGEPIMKICSPWSFYEILTRWVFPDKKLELKAKHLAKFKKRMTKAFKNIKANDWAVVDDSDLEQLKKLSDKNDWPEIINAQLGDWFDSIDNAVEDLPKD